MILNLFQKKTQSLKVRERERFITSYHWFITILTEDDKIVKEKLETALAILTF